MNVPWTSLWTGECDSLSQRRFRNFRSLCWIVPKDLPSSYSKRNFGGIERRCVWKGSSGRVCHSLQVIWETFLPSLTERSRLFTRALKIKGKFLGKSCDNIYSRAHYVEYLGLLIWQNHLDPISILSTDDLEVIIRRAYKKHPGRPYPTSDEDFRKRLLKVWTNKCYINIFRLLKLLSHDAPYNLFQVINEEIPL